MGWMYDLRILTMSREMDILAADRLATCRQCEHQLCSVCTLCGCPIKKKTKVANETCPDNLWYPITYSHNDEEIIFGAEIPEELLPEFLRFTKDEHRPDVDDAFYLSQWSRFLLTLQ